MMITGRLTFSLIAAKDADMEFLAKVLNGGLSTGWSGEKVLMLAPSNYSHPTLDLLLMDMIVDSTPTVSHDGTGMTEITVEFKTFTTPEVA